MTSSLRSGLHERTERFGVVGLVVIGTLAVGGVLLAARQGVGPAGITVTAVVAAAVGLGILQLPSRWSGPLWLLAIVAGIVLARWTVRPLAFPWVAFLYVGEAVALQLRHRSQAQRRARAGLPPERRPRRPQHGQASQLRMVRDDGDDRVETVDPPLADVREAVRALDGRTRTGISVLRGTARLDVGGNASGPLGVYQCDDVDVKGLPVWSVISPGGDPWAGAGVDLRLVGIDANLPAGGLTTLDAALAAVDAFLLTGGRAPGLPWRTGRDVDDLRAIFEALA